MTTLALQDESSYPTRLIAPTSTLEETENGWVKTYQWVNAKGMEFKMSTGEGPKFYETKEHFSKTHRNKLAYILRGLRTISRALFFLSSKELLGVLLKCSLRLKPWV